jgi:hypothetical protein
MDDETARATMVCHVDLETADSFLLGWQQQVIFELERMRSAMPYADTLVLRLVCERSPDASP